VRILSKFKLIIVIVCLSAFISCDKDNKTVPTVPVDIYINTNDPQFADLNIIGNWIYITGGSQGIIVINEFNSFRAFDRHSPYEPQNGCRVWMDADNIYLEDECSDSKFEKYDGIPVEGPATRTLKEYNAVLAGDIIHIYNF